MNFLDLVKKRQSVREYQNKPVEREKIERCLQAAQLAPSAVNSQSWYFIVIDEPALKNDIAKKTFSRIVSFNRFSLQAPVLIVVVSEHSGIVNKIGEKIKNTNFNLINIGIAVEHICLQAVEEGLGTCILGWFDKKGVKDILKIPASKKVDLIITLGYSASPEIRPKKRKKLDEIRNYNQYK